MKEVTKEYLFKRFSQDFACRVWYKNQSNPKHYDSCRYVNWKNVRKRTVLFAEPKTYYYGPAGVVRRDGICFLFNQ